jgi:SAM-dependent methyltransferase
VKKALRALLRRFVPVRALPSGILLWKGGRSGLFARYGWARSLRTKTPVDEQGQPIPWIPYAAVNFLVERLRPDLTVLEFGAGHSTLFFMGRVARVLSIEHQKSWVDWVRARAAANVTVVEADGASPDAYLAPLRDGSSGFDFVFVDGVHRTEAFAEALGLLTPRGVIVLDDSQRPAYAPAFAAAAEAGLRHLHFEGHKAASVNLYRTTVFYSDGNCLGI